LLASIISKKLSSWASTSARLVKVLSITSQFERERRHAAVAHQFVPDDRAETRGLLAAPVVVEDRPIRLVLTGLLDNLPGPVDGGRVLAVAGEFWVL